MVNKIIKPVDYFFVDESGDPTFYDKNSNQIVGNQGVSKILILGFIKTENPKQIRQAVLNQRDQIAKDKYLEGIPSLQKTLISFHAKDDCPEIRERFFRAMVGLNFTAEIFVARKNYSIFTKKHNRNENEFYDDLITKLFENKLHLAEHNEIFFAVRGNKTRQAPLENAIEKAKKIFEGKWNKKIDSTVKINPQSPSGEPCLQVIDYINWAIYRAFIRGEMRFYRFIEEKIKYLVDIYDLKKYPKNYYNSRNKFDVKNISPL